MSDDKNKKAEDATDFLMESMRLQGIAASTVKDGTILCFQREYMEKLMASHPTKDEFFIFIQRREFKN